jgi:hypothetical protein
MYKIITLSALLLLSTVAVAKEATKEFPYIQPIAVEHAAINTNKQDTKEVQNKSKERDSKKQAASKK